MSTNMAPLPARYPTDTAQSTTSQPGRSQKPRRAGARASNRPADVKPTTAAPPSGKADARSGKAAARSGGDGGWPTGHHARKPPDDHLCTCGKLREDCVRDTVRALWSA